MIVDGRAIAGEILTQVADGVAQLSAAPRLTIITCTPDLPTQKYLALKKRKAVEVGARVNVIELIAGCTTEQVVQTVQVATEQSDGIIVQLPLPDSIDTDAVLAAIPAHQDIDRIHYDGTSGVLPPVVGAIAAIATRHNISFQDTAVTVVGAGRLVGAPAALWAERAGAQVTIVTRDTDPADVTAALAAADSIITGAGVPGLITPERIKAGVAIFDAGTSEARGALVGDADPACTTVAGLFTPVPGGIGPVTVSCLLANLLELARR